MAASSRRKSFYADLDRLKYHFDDLDPHKSGYIGNVELAKLVQSMHGLEESMVPELMERLDRDKDGKVSFDDFKVLFQQEKDTGAILSPHSTDSEVSPIHLSSTSANLSQSLEYNTALENFPSISEIDASPRHERNHAYFDPSLADEERDVLSSPTVVLRHKPGRRSHSKMGRSYSEGVVLSPIHSTELTDLATQMRYLTTGDVVDSPQLRRNSKVLSWISETEDQYLFEDTGTGFGETQGMISPPMSPVRSGGGSDEASHVKSILQSVCHSQEIDRDAIAKLCSHVKADPQEEQELISLLNHLDSRKKGHVTLDEFVRGLQSVKNSAVVMETPPARVIPRRHSEGPPLLYGEKCSTPKSSLPAAGPIASTPLPPAVKAAYQEAILSVLDPDNSGYVKVDSLVSEWQKMGVEAPHDCSLENVLAEAIPVDPSGRVSVTELTTSLEGAILTEGRAQNILRQVALKSFKGEIKSLRSSMHQLSLERDQLRNSLNRTMDENKRLVREGDEQSDQIARSTEIKIREQQLLHSHKLRDIEHARQEETQLLHERASRLVTRMEEKINQLRTAEEKLRIELKYSHDELQDMIERLSLAHREIGLKERTIKLLQKDLAIFTEGSQDNDDTPYSSVLELQKEISEKEELMNELHEKLRELQDQSDLHLAEIEQWKHKYTSVKRKSQRRRSTSKRSDGKPSQRKRRHSTGDKEHKSPVPPSSNRPHSSFIRRAPLQSIDMDTSDLDDPLSVDYSEHELPVEAQSVESAQLVEPFEEEYRQLPVDEGPGSSDELTPHSVKSPRHIGSGTSDDEDYFARSSASLLEELQIEEHKTQLERKIDQLHKEKLALEENCRRLEMQVRSLKKFGDSDDLLRDLGLNRQKLAELDRQICKLAKQRRKISTARLEVDTQMARAEQQIAQQLVEIHRLREIRAIEQAEYISKIEQVTQELLKMQCQLEDEQKSRDLTLKKLHDDIAKLEKQNHSKNESFLTLKDEHNKTYSSLKSLQERIKSERQLHEKQCKELELKIQEAEALISEHETKHEVNLRAAKKELENAQSIAAQCKVQMESLALKLDKVQKTSDAKELAVQKRTVATLSAPLPESPASARVNTSTNEEIEIERLKKRLEQAQQKCAQAIEMNEQLQKEVEIARTKLVTADENAQLDIAKLKSQLDHAQKELSDILCRHELELSQLESRLKLELETCNHRAEVKLAEANDLHLRKESAKQMHELQLEAAKHKLKSSELHGKNLQEKLSLVTVQYDKALADIARLKDRELDLQGQVTSLEQHAEQYKSDVSQLTIEIDKWKDDLSVSMGKEKQHLDNIASLNNQLRIQARQLQQAQALPEEEPDAVSYVSSPRSPRLYEPLVHDEIIGEMKSQLEELQKLLVLQGKRTVDGEEDELSIVQELLSANEKLRVEMQGWKSRVAKERAELAEAISRKESEFEQLHAEMENEKRSVKELAAESARMILGKSKHLEHAANQTLTEYQDKIDGVSRKLAAVGSTLKDRNTRHSNALESMLTDLDQSRSEIDSCKQEMERLKEAFDQSQDELNRSQSDLHVHELHRAKDADEESNRTAQLEEISKRDRLIVQKDEELQVLRAEVARMRLTEFEMKEGIKARQKEIQQRDSNIAKTIDDVVARDQQIRDLEERLQQLVEEPVEAVVQYVEMQPLENMSDAVMVGMQREMESEREKAKELWSLHQIELQKLKDDLNRSLTDSEQLALMKQLLEDIEQKLAALQEEKLILQQEHESELQLLNGELANNTGELKDLHDFLVQPLDGGGLATRREGREILVEEEWQPDHSELITEMRTEIETLKVELRDEREVCAELEAMLQISTEEHEQQDAQFHTEHEEEVKALRQQKQQLVRQQDEMKAHYQQLVDDQDDQNTILLQDLVNNKAGLEKQLREKTEEAIIIYQKLTDLLDEKNTLMDIVKELCVEAGKQIDIV